MVASFSLACAWGFILVMRMGRLDERVEILRKVADPFAFRFPREFPHGRLSHHECVGFGRIFFAATAS